MSMAGWQEGIAQNYARELYRRRGILRPPIRMLGERRPRRRRPRRKRSTNPATFSFTRWPKSWASTASRNTPPSLGLGQKTGIDLPQEVSGVMPSEEWKIAQLQAEMVCRRNHFCRHRAGRGRGHAGAVVARHQRDLDGRALVVPHVDQSHGFAAGLRGGAALSPK